MNQIKAVSLFVNSNVFVVFGKKVKSGKGTWNTSL